MIKKRNCKVCGKEYELFTNNPKNACRGTSNIIKRSRRCVTCSRKCAKIWERGRYTRNNTKAKMYKGTYIGIKEAFVDIKKELKYVEANKIGEYLSIPIVIVKDE